MLDDCMTLSDLIHFIFTTGSIFQITPGEAVHLLLPNGRDLIYQFVPEYSYYCTIGELL